MKKKTINNRKQMKMAVNTTGNMVKELQTLKKKLSLLKNF